MLAQQAQDVLTAIDAMNGEGHRGADEGRGGAGSDRDRDSTKTKRSRGPLRPPRPGRFLARGQRAERERVLPGATVETRSPPPAPVPGCSGRGNRGRRLSVSGIVYTGTKNSKTVAHQAKNVESGSPQIITKTAWFHPAK